jgi:hypothetical protein
MFFIISNRFTLETLFENCVVSSGVPSRLKTDFDPGLLEANIEGVAVGNV